jgi:SAM-dependent methyltransferase
MIEAGLTFGVEAAAYERGRPEWPPELLNRLPVGPDARVVDLGAGTGKLTRLLASAYSGVVAVEPDPAMRRLIDAGEPVAGSAEAIPLAEASVDAVFAAEAFHWFDWDRAVPEIARVLRPRGVLALLWNRYDPKDFVLPEGLMPPVAGPKHGRFVSGEWRHAFDGAPFDSFREDSVFQELDVCRDRLIDYFASVSPITSLPPPSRAEALERVATALDRDVYRRRWTTEFFWALRR